MRKKSDFGYVSLKAEKDSTETALRRNYQAELDKILPTYRELEKEIDDSKGKEQDMMNTYIPKNAIVGELEKSEEGLVGLNKLVKQVEILNAEIEALDVKLSIVENYLVRLKIEKEIYEIKQTVETLQQKIVNVYAVIDNEKLQTDLNRHNTLMDASIAESSASESEIKLEIEKKQNQRTAKLQDVDNLKEKLNSNEDEKKNLKLEAEYKAKEAEQKKLQEEKQRTQEFISDIARKYPEGVYQDVVFESNRSIERTIVNKNNVVDVYKKIKYNWGGVYYFKNEKAISYGMFQSETTVSNK